MQLKTSHVCIIVSNLRIWYSLGILKFKKKQKKKLYVDLFFRKIIEANLFHNNLNNILCIKYVNIKLRYINTGLYVNFFLCEKFLYT